MQTQICETQASHAIGQSRSRDWMHDVIALLDGAIGHLHQEQAAHSAILEATWLLRRQLDPQPAIGFVDDGKERLLAWQVRKVLDYIDRHITNRVLVADLCALVWRSEAHFSRSFRATFGYSPHAFVIRRRVELAAKYMPLPGDVHGRCGSEQSQSPGRRYRVSARLHAELDEDAFDVGLHGLGGNLQLLSDAFVGKSTAHRVQDAVFARTQ